MTDTTAGDGVNEVIAALEALTKGEPTDEFDRGARAARLNALDMLWPLATPAQPSAGVQAELLDAADKAHRACMSAWSCGEPYHRVKSMMDAVEHLGRVVGRAKDATPAQPDTGDVAALREALEPFAALADKFTGPMVEVSDPHPDNPSRNIQPLPTVYLERAHQTLSLIHI